MSLFCNPNTAAKSRLIIAQFLWLDLLSPTGTTPTRGRSFCQKVQPPDRKPISLICPICIATPPAPWGGRTRDGRRSIVTAEPFHISASCEQLQDNWLLIGQSEWAVASPQKRRVHSDGSLCALHNHGVRGLRMVTICVDTKALIDLAYLSNS